MQLQSFSQLNELLNSIRLDACIAFTDPFHAPLECVYTSTHALHYELRTTYICT